MHFNPVEINHHAYPSVTCKSREELMLLDKVAVLATGQHLLTHTSEGQRIRASRVFSFTKGVIGTVF